MQYRKAFDIWQLDELRMKLIQPGQWVYAGTPDNKGQFWGIRSTGTVVVAWLNNAKRQKSSRAYNQALLNYARG